jgi:hypothetical protein
MLLLLLLLNRGMQAKISFFSPQNILEVTFFKVMRFKVLNYSYTSLERISRNHAILCLRVKMP